MLKKKNKAFVLPSTIVSLVVISLFSILIFSIIISIKSQNTLLARKSSEKLLEEQIFYNFKYNGSLDFDGVTIYEFDVYDELDELPNISAIIAIKNETTICFGIYDFDNGEVICYQHDNFAYEIQEDETKVYLLYDDLTFVKDKK